MRILLLAVLLIGTAAWAGPTTKVQLPPAGGGGIDPRDFSDHMPLMQRAAIERELERSAARLRAEGLLPASATLGAPSGLQWPLRAAPGYRFEDYHGISNFVDLQPAFPDQLLDFNCGVRTYDLDSGYNHAGIDYFLWPYPWWLMDQGQIEVVAAAAGTILAKHDGNNDRSCGTFTGPNWNAVYVQHGDGSVAWYGHLQLQSLTTKGVGENVEAGEYLGLVGSSGFSSGPHLHLELRSSSAGGATIYEPHSGTCRAGESLWASQRAYYDSALNGIAVHDAEPSMNVPCPNPTQEQPRFADSVALGTRVYLSIYFRDEVPGNDVTTLRLYRPDGSLRSEWSKSAPGVHYSASWWYWWFDLGVDPGLQGEWRFEVQFRQQVLSRSFQYGASTLVHRDGFEPFTQ